MGKASEEDAVLNALRRLLRGKTGKQEFVFHNNNEARRCLGLEEKISSRRLGDVLRHLNGGKKIRVVASGSRRIVTIPN